MKKLLFAVVLGLLLIAALATTALADNGPHGSFTATTDACASCHRVHSAQYGSNSLLIMDPEALCLSCHDGAGAGTNVEDGVYTQDGLNIPQGAGTISHVGGGADSYYGGGVTEGLPNGSLLAGGFQYAVIAHTWNGALSGGAAAVSEATTSAHDIGVTGTVWGSGAANSANGSVVLECTSCHDPHGTSGYTNTGVANTDNLVNACDPSKTGTNPCTTKVASYRLLRFQPAGSNGFTNPGSFNWTGGAFPSNGSTTGWTVPDNFAAVGTEWYTIGSQTTLTNCGQNGTSACGAPFAVGDYNAGNAEIAYQPLNTVTSTTQNYRPAAISTAYFCAQCHDRYFNNSSLRNNTDLSAFCGKPTASTSTLAIPVIDDADGVAPWIHPNDAVRCEPIVNASNVLINWGDNGDSGDTVYKYRHSSGDVLRASADGAVALSTSAGRFRVARSCVACHVAHGTTATMTAFASDATLAADLVDPADTNVSVLLRMDNRSICLRCHASGVNFTVLP